jgi:hypothetical protein
MHFNETRYIVYGDDDEYQFGDHRTSCDQTVYVRIEIRSTYNNAKADGI